MVSLASEKWASERRAIGQLTRDKHGVGMMVLSITSLGRQGEADQEKSETLAKCANHYMDNIESKIQLVSRGLVR